MSIDHGKVLAVVEEMTAPLVSYKFTPSQQAHITSWANKLRALAQPAEAVDGREPVVWRVPTKYGIGYSFASEEVMRELCGPAEAVEGDDGELLNDLEAEALLAWPRGVEQRFVDAREQRIAKLCKRAIAALAHDAAQGAVAIPPEAVEIEGTALLAGCARIGDWAIPTKCGARIVDARMAYGWNQCREAMMESDTHPQAAPAQGDGRRDLYDELASALGCDEMDSHEGRIARAKKLAASSQEGE